MNNLHNSMDSLENIHLRTERTHTHTGGAAAITDKKNKSVCSQHFGLISLRPHPLPKINNNLVMRLGPGS